MALLDLELDEKFYNNKPSTLKLNIKINPMIDKKGSRYIEAQQEMETLGDRLKTVIKEYIDS